MVKIMVSARHVHLSHEDYRILFGQNEMMIEKELTQPGEYASNLYVDIKCNDCVIRNVRVLGPTRSYTQVELSKTDSYLLKIDPPVRESGDLEGALPLEIICKDKSIIRNCCIIAQRHIHISSQERLNMGLLNVNKVSLLVEGEKGAVLHNVYLKEKDDAVFEAHLDLDDANANLLVNGSVAEILVD